MSAKISALPVLTPFTVTDVLCGLVGGADSQITRDTFLTAGPTDTMTIAGVTGIFQIDTTGKISLVCNAAASIEFDDGSGVAGNLTSSGGWLFFSPSNLFQVTGLAGATIQMQATGALLFVDTSGASAFVTYVPTVPGNWAFNPADLAAAIDRLAAAVAGLLLGPIP